jgi:hypothetical protein
MLDYNKPILKVLAELAPLFLKLKFIEQSLSLLIGLITLKSSQRLRHWPEAPF